MVLLFRTPAVALRALAARRTGVFEESRLHLRVLPNDLDLNFHMNNGRFLTLMDLGRIDLMIRNGILWRAYRRHWLPVVGDVRIRFRRSLSLFQSFDLVTTLLGWDDRYFFMEQRFESQGTDAARAIVHGALRGKDGAVLPSTVLALIDHHEPSPALLPEAH